VVSSHPFASSPSSLNGTGYGSRRGPNGNGPSGVALISKYARSKREVYAASGCLSPSTLAAALRRR
jgi:hypothetical protein